MRSNAVVSLLALDRVVLLETVDVILSCHVFGGRLVFGGLGEASSVEHLGVEGEGSDRDEGREEDDGTSDTEVNTSNWVRGGESQPPPLGRKENKSGN